MLTYLFYLLHYMFDKKSSTQNNKYVNIVNKFFDVE
jgi:hypothetical protein